MPSKISPTPGKDLVKHPNWKPKPPKKKPVKTPKTPGTPKNPVRPGVPNPIYRKK